MFLLAQDCLHIAATARQTLAFGFQNTKHLFSIGNSYAGSGTQSCVVTLSKCNMGQILFDMTRRKTTATYMHYTPLTFLFLAQISKICYREGWSCGVFIGVENTESSLHPDFLPFFHQTCF